MDKIIIIAELCFNWSHFDMAKAMIRTAADCGADIAKFQLFDVEKENPSKEIIAQGRNWYEEIKSKQLTKEQAFELAQFCEGVGIEFLATTYDLERLDWLEEIGVKRHKIATKSVRIQNFELMREVLKTGKPIIISVPYGHIHILTQEECPLSSILQDTERDTEKIKLLYCVPEYPTELCDLDFNEFDFGEKWLSGFSDHTIGTEASMIATARGAKVIEKHFTLSRFLDGPDQICSIEPHELKQLVDFTRKCEEVLYND